VGAGPGLLSLDIARLLYPSPSSSSEVRFVVTDLVPEMVETAKARLAEFKKAEVMVADAQSLSFPDHSFDRYIANLSLMLVPDANVTLRECFRVLKPGGVAAFSIWGDESKSPMMTIVPRLFPQITPPVVPAPSRSNFYLGKQGSEALKAQFQRAGFTGSYVSFHQSLIAEALNADDFVTHMAFASPHIRDQFSNGSISETQRAELRERTLKDAQAVLDSGSPIAMDCILIIVQKPL